MDSQESLESLVRNAIDQDELHELILGKPGFEHVPKYSPTPWETDHTAVLSRLAIFCADSEVSQRVDRAVAELAQSYVGLVPAAICYLYEMVARRRNLARLGLDLSGLGAKLRSSAMAHRSELEVDRTGAGAQWPDGLYGELRHLNATCVELGGEPFLSVGS